MIIYRENRTENRLKTGTRIFRIYEVTKPQHF